MTADDARRLTQDAVRIDEGKAKIVLDLWVRAIEQAAKEGQSRVGESSVGKVRTPIPAAARTAALNELKARGFTVKTVQTGHNESETEVSW